MESLRGVQSAGVCGAGNDLLRLSSDPDFYAHYAAKSCEGSRFYSREHVAAMWRHFYNSLPTEHFLKRPLFRY
ncbi:MAG: hypothetical protein II828_04305 [Clostridia bacterium]|nr:hypothetical protein [Clostridia bacterium]